MPGAKKPDGKGARTERVTFTRPAADRIAKVVRQVEAGDRDSAGLHFGVRAPMTARVPFRVCTFTGTWAKGATKTVTFKYQTTAPNTASAINLFAEIGTATIDLRNCAIAREGTEWFLIAAEC